MGLRYLTVAQINNWKKELPRVGIRPSLHDDDVVQRKKSECNFLVIDFIPYFISK